MRLSRADKAFKAVCYFVAILVALLCLYPLLYVLFVSLVGKTEWNETNGMLFFFPRNPTLGAYFKVLASGGYFLRATTISVLRALIGTVSGVFINVCVGYALSRENLPGRKGIMILLMITILFGAGLIPAYLNIKQLGLLNSFWVMIIPGMVNSWNILLFKQFFEGVPKSLQEAAIIDGSGEFTLMTRICMPMAKSAISAIALFSMVGHWNAWFDAMIYIDSTHSSLWPLQLYTMVSFNNTRQFALNPEQMFGLTTQSSTEVPNIAIQMALVVVGLIPILIIYPFFQKYFTSGVYTGAVKG